MTFRDKISPDTASWRPRQPAALPQPTRPILAEDCGLLHTSALSKAVLLRTRTLGAFLVSQPLPPYLPV